MQPSNGRRLRGANLGYRNGRGGPCGDAPMRAFRSAFAISDDMTTAKPILSPFAGEIPNTSVRSGAIVNKDGMPIFGGSVKYLGAERRSCTLGFK